MLETTEFFQKQAQDCRNRAAQIRKKEDREFWLRLAHRWEGLSQGPKNAEVPKLRSRTVVEKRFSKSRRAA
jgi:hypothetical protein